MDDLPSNFSPLSNPVSGVDFDVSVCKKVSVDGVDQGPAAIMALSVVIKPPTGAPPGSHTSSWFLLEVRSDNEFVRSWMKAKLLSPATATLSNSFSPQPDPAWWGDLESEAKLNGTSLYRVKTVPEKALRQRDSLVRWYFGPDPRSDFWEMRYLHNHSAGDGDGVLEASPQSVLARVANGVTNWEGLGDVENPQYRMFRSPPKTS